LTDRREFLTRAGAVLSAQSALDAAGEKAIVVDATPLFDISVEAAKPDLCLIRVRSCSFVARCFEHSPRLQ
jgi:hypothetical protein